MPRDRREKRIGPLSFGFFILLFALFFIIVPDYHTKVSQFIDSFKLQEAPLYLPAPQGHHPVIYETVTRFCIVFGVFQILILGLRFYLRSSVSKMAETSSNIVIWFGAAFMFSLLHSETLLWFPFIGGIVAVFGFSLIVRNLIVLLFWHQKR